MPFTVDADTDRPRDDVRAARPQLPFAGLPHELSASARDSDTAAWRRQRRRAPQATLAPCEWRRVLDYAERARTRCDRRIAPRLVRDRTATDTPRDTRAASGTARPHRRVRHVGVPLSRRRAGPVTPYLSVAVVQTRHPGRDPVRSVAVLPPLPADRPPHGPIDRLSLRRGCTASIRRTGPTRRAPERPGQRARVRRPATRRASVASSSTTARGGVAEDLRSWDLAVVGDVLDLSGVVPRPVVPGLIQVPRAALPRLSRNLEDAAQHGVPRLATLARAGLSPRGQDPAPSTSTPRAPGSRRRPRIASTAASGSTSWARPRGPEFRLARMYGMCLGILSIVVNPAEGLGEFEHADLRCDLSPLRAGHGADGDRGPRRSRRRDRRRPGSVTAATIAPARSSVNSPHTPAMEEIAVMASRRVLLLRSRSAVLVAVGWIAPTPASAQTEVRTQLGWLRNGEFAPVMVAEAKGFFTEEGIRHRIVDGGPGKNPVPIVGAGQATFGITARRQQRLPGPARQGSRSTSSPVGTLLQRGPYSYITLGNPD